MNNAQRFNFTESVDAFGVSDLVPQLPLSLTYRESTLEVLGLLGRMNFFLEFDVCFYRSQQIFEVCPVKLDKI